jgi:hypothetical protein
MHTLKPGSHLKVGEFLGVGDYIVSPNGVFFAQVQADGNFCVYRGHDPDHQYKNLWCSHKLGAGGKFFALMQGDGNFVVYKGTGPRDQQEALWGTDKLGPGGKFYAKMQDDGNFAPSGAGPGCHRQLTMGFWQDGLSEGVRTRR